jgi:methylenetetrahydrofolate reductase (NADPH)
MPISHPHLSFEFFPPKTNSGAEKLWECVRRLAVWQPEFVSITCGAGGSSIDGTFAVARHIRETMNINIAPHMAMGRQRRSRLRAAVDEYKKLGVRHVVAIRGDLSQTGEEIPADDIYPNTIDFVAELHADFGIEPIVAAYPDMHPMAESPQQDLDHLKRKIAAGARFAVTQFFFEPPHSCVFGIKRARRALTCR